MKPRIESSRKKWLSSIPQPVAAEVVVKPTTESGDHNSIESGVGNMDLAVTPQRPASACSQPSLTLDRLRSYQGSRPASSLCH